MTLAISKALEEGPKAVVCASTGNTSASAAAYAAKAGLTCAVLVPKGKVAHGQDGGDARARRARCSRSRATSTPRSTSHAIWRTRYPVTLVNSVNPFRLQGQKTRGLRDLRHARPRARHPLRAGRQRGQHLEPLARLLRVPCRRRDRASRRSCSASRPPARRRSSAASRWRIRRRSPRRSGSGTPPRGTSRSRRRAARRAASGRSPIGRSSPPIGRSRARDCSRSRRARRASRDCCRRTSEGRVPAGATVVCILTGHGLKDPEWAISGAAQPVTVPADAAVVAEELGLAASPR